VAANATNPHTGLAPTYRLPTENEWYKAAYYSPNLGGTVFGGYYAYATQNDSAISGNYNNAIGYATDVGSFSGSGSFYGTFDQSGNVYQWNDLDGTSLQGSVFHTGSSRGLRGGDWYNDTYYASSLYRLVNDPNYSDRYTGFRLTSPV